MVDKLKIPPSFSLLVETLTNLTAIFFDFSVLSDSSNRNHEPIYIYTYTDVGSL